MSREGIPMNVESDKQESGITIDEKAVQDAIDSGWLGKLIRLYEDQGETVPAEKLIIFGDSFKENGASILDAILAYKKANAGKKIIDLGLWCFEKGLLHEGEAAYKAAGIEVPKSNYVLVGNAALSGGFLEEAEKMYDRAGLTISQGEMEKCAEIALKNGDMLEAKYAFEKADVSFPEK